MRRMHWWGAAAGVGVLAVTAAGASAAFAAPDRKPVTTHATTAHAAPAHPAVKHPAVKHPAVKHPAVKPVPAKPGRKPVTVKHHDEGHGHHHPGCPYPPHGRPDVSISARNHVHLNDDLVITGAMKVNGCGYDKFLAGLYKLVKGPHHAQQWLQVGTATTGQDGALSFTLKPTSTEVYRVMTAAGDGLAQGWSNAMKIEYRPFPH